MKRAKFLELIVVSQLLALFLFCNRLIATEEKFDALKSPPQSQYSSEEALNRKQEELKARQEELARKKEERLKKLAEERQKRQEEFAKKQEELKVRQEELARQIEERRKQIAEQEARQEQELEARQEELTRQKEERLKKAAEQKERKQEKLLKEQQELKARQEELARKKEEKQKQLAEQKAKQEQELKAKQEKLARQKEVKQKQLAEQKAKQEQELKARQEELARQKEERLKKAAEQKERKQEKLLKEQQELKARQEKLARQKEEKQKQLAEQKAEQEQELKAKQDELARKKEEEKQKQITDREEKRQQELKARQDELARKKEEFTKKINEIKKSTLQEKAITEAMLKKQRQDRAKIIKIEKLWQEARKLYDRGMYEQAIKDFEEIIKLEGNPRIKYTPFAKEYILKAKDRLTDKNKVELSKEVSNIEKDMINEVLKKQVPPYIEPPHRTEKIEGTSLIEPPPIRKKLKEKKINMDFDKVDLKSVISFLSQETGINFIASQKVLEIAPKVTARFNDTPVDEVIKYITKNIGLVYRIDKEVVWIAHPEEVANEALETRVYYLNKGGGLFTEFTPITSGTTETGLGGSSASISKIATIEDTLKTAVPWPGDAKLTYDKRLNALIVRNTPQNLQMLEDMLYNLDIAPLQVLIEARFLEVNVTDTEELGLEWKISSGDYALKERNGTYKAGIGKDSGVDFTSFSRVAEGLNLTYKGMLTNSQFQAVLHALEESKKTKTLSSPRITTLNNQMATIKVVDEWIYPTRYEYEIVQFDLNGDGDYNDAGETTYKNVPKDFMRRDVGILLKVIPSVGADRKTINLSLIPEVSEGTADAFEYTGDVKLPKFTSRNLSTTVVVNSSDTVVLGGLIKESRTKTLTKVPIFGDIPLLGAFFRKNADSIERKNLLIFVTAKILSPSGEEVTVAQK